ncbi:MAG TPA: nucleotidyltransferase domain-containing protein [Oscillospiraceae bacterium]|nr:nucleotidyltransferase domain-containing protein [Oscillospiraceae bacterium]
MDRADVPVPICGLLRRVRSELTALPWVDRVLLFGSFARGDWSLESDVDLAVFARRGAPCGLAQYKILSRICRDPRFDVQVQLFSAEELDDPCGIVEEIAAYGVDLAEFSFASGADDKS